MALMAGESVETYTRLTVLAPRAARSGYTIRGRPNTGVRFLPGNPELPSRPSSRAHTCSAFFAMLILNRPVSVRAVGARESPSEITPAPGRGCEQDSTLGGRCERPRCARGARGCERASSQSLWERVRRRVPCPPRERCRSEGRLSLRPPPGSSGTTVPGRRERIRTRRGPDSGHARAFHSRPRRQSSGPGKAGLRYRRGRRATRPFGFARHTPRAGCTRDPTAPQPPPQGGPRPAPPAQGPRDFEKLPLQVLEGEGIVHPRMPVVPRKAFIPHD